MLCLGGCAGSLLCLSRVFSLFFFFVLHLIFFLISMDSEENVMMSPVNDSSPLSVDDPEMIFGHSSSIVPKVDLNNLVKLVRPEELSLIHI